MRRLLLLSLLVLVTVPAGASAMTRVETSGPSILLYKWPPYEEGEFAAPMDLRLSGDGAAVTVEGVQRPELRGGCTADPAPATSITCRPPAGYPALLGVSPVLGDGADRFDATGLTLGIVMAANGGDDIVTGGSGADYLAGDQGDDELHGGPGDDVVDLQGVFTTDPDTKASDCGDGDDILKRGTDDLVGTLPGCEHEVGFPGWRSLPAAPAPGTTLSAGAPPTGSSAGYQWRTCDAGGCGDVVGTGATYTPTGADIGRAVQVDASSAATGGPNGQTYTGTAQVRSGVVAPLPGVPSNPSGPPADTVAPRVAVPARARQATVRKSVATFTFGTVAEPVTGTLTLTAGKTVLGKAKLVAAAGKRLTARVRFGAKARRLLKRSRTVKAKAALLLRDAAGNVRTTRFRVALRRR